ncbi:MAG TPA: hypothetical protein DD491_10410, partial [Halieaceae bacterium]|nr:hypothetical protein [Halieaceae bacterium]
ALNEEFQEAYSEHYDLVYAEEYADNRRRGMDPYDAGEEAKLHAHEAAREHAEEHVRELELE